MIYYKIEGVNDTFRTLTNAKHHVCVAFTQRERVKYLTNYSICKIVGERIVTKTPILVTNDAYSFGKTKRL